MPSGKLSLQGQGATTVAALMAARRTERLTAECAALLAAGAAVADLREAAYVAALFCGFPLGVAALVELSQLAGTDVHSDAAPVDRAELGRLGERLFRDIHRTNADRQLAMLHRVHPDFADTVLSEAYGRVLARGFLPLAVRELAGVAALTVLGLGPQLRAHLLGAHNCGASWDVLDQVIRRAAALADISTNHALAELVRLQADDSAT